MEPLQALLILAALGTGVWVYLDARRRRPGDLFGLVWALGTMLLWPFGLFGYLIFRPKPRIESEGESE